MLNMEFMDVCFRELITNKMNEKIYFINNSLPQIASNKAFGLAGVNYIQKIVTKINTNVCEGFAVHNVFWIHTVICRVLEGHGFMREVIIYDLEGEILDLPYTVVKGQGFLDTVQLLLVDLALPRVLDIALLERHIRKGIWDE